MRTSLRAVLLVSSGSAVAALVGVLMLLSAPLEGTIAPGSLSVRQVRIGSEEFALIRGDPRNCLGQIQGIAVSCDPERRTIAVRAYVIRWHPFARHYFNSDWPILYPLNGLPAGTYDVIYAVDGSMDIAGRVTSTGVSRQM